MPIPFTCPHCGEQTLVDEHYAGHEGPCVNCGRVVTVPGEAPRTAVTAAPRTEVQAKDRVPGIVISMAVLAGVASLIVIAVMLVVPAIGVVRERATRRRCGANLQQLALAIHAYEQAYGSYPPAVTLGPDGKPWHSWRVLVLPYLGHSENELYQRYDLKQPWDSPHNILLLNSMPEVFVSPADDDAKLLYETSYLAVLGSQMALGAVTPTSSARIADGLDQTVLLVEVRGAGISWTEPRDLDARSILFRIGSDLGGNHPGGVNVVTADAQPHFLPDSYTPEEVHALLTVDGGENVSVGND